MPKKQEEQFWRKPLLVFGKMSAWVATPIIAALFIGRYLDEKWGTAPWIFLGLTGFSFVISCYGIYKEAKQYIKDIGEKDSK